MGSSADIGSDLDKFWEAAGFFANTTEPKAYKSQASGLFGAGSLYVRAPVKRYELITLDLPDYHAGCAGIDLFTGSLSYINGDKLTNLGRQIMSNSSAYAVDVMLATTVPELKQVRDFLQATVQKVNQSSINSCEMAQNLVGGIWPKTTASQQKICNDQRRMGREGLGHDYVEARMACANQGFQETMERAAQNTPKRVLYNKNLVWDAMQGLLSANQEVAELIMSLTGTIIIDKKNQITQVPAIIDNGEIIQALLGLRDSKFEIWKCDEKQKCLHPRLSLTATPKSLSAKVRETINAIDAKLESDTRLSNDEKSFLEMTSIPVLKFLMVLKGTNQATDIDNYATLIASDLLATYLKSLMSSLASTIITSELSDDLLADIKNRIQHANEVIANIDIKTDKKLKERLALIQSIEAYERQLSGSFK